MHSREEDYDIDCLYLRILPVASMPDIDVFGPLIATLTFSSKVEAGP